MADQQPIDDALLGKFLAGETDPVESARVREWLISQKAGLQEPTHDDFAKFERIWEASRVSAKPVDTDAAWNKVRQKMRGNDTSAEPDTIIKPLSVTRNEKSINWRETLVRIAAVLVLIMSLGWMVYRLQHMSQRYAAEQISVLVAADKQVRKTLPDGTQIVLNRQSTLRYPTAFTGDTRDVTLTGEAFFDVTPNAEHPFRIQAQSTVVQVLGTSFNVRAYDANVNVAVETGKVRFAGPRKSVLLTPNQQATFDAKADTLRRTLAVTPNTFAYKTGQLVFDNEPLRNVVQTINQFYNADVRLANATLGNCLLKTRFDNMALEDVLNVTAETLTLRVRYQGKQIILDGDGCQ
ncbi:FecR domain-containing protein [Spirosoma sp. BT702]|uniref:FecR domain-containing protein n=1 Tax=Spirosoma profusum TaxID=2771354 RepID=A0A927ASX3_9BACT|nr:FecR domain-containing protein [Spirosoma profusum]MBD2701925.1 FecR domain-containing protein [Spirosoma profusum]